MYFYGKAHVGSCCRWKDDGTKDEVTFLSLLVLLSTLPWCCFPYIHVVCCYNSMCMIIKLFRDLYDVIKLGFMLFYENICLFRIFILFLFYTILSSFLSFFYKFCVDIQTMKLWRLVLCGKAFVVFVFKQNGTHVFVSLFSISMFPLLLYLPEKDSWPEGIIYIKAWVRQNYGMSIGNSGILSVVVIVCSL